MWEQVMGTGNGENCFIPGRPWVTGGTRTATRISTNSHQKMTLQRQIDLKCFTPTQKHQNKDPHYTVCLAVKFEMGYWFKKSHRFY